jgi:hypothetical protein
VGAAGKAAIALGLLANPICLWSEYTLKTTGAGLPPGPGGALGAAEGISYLVRREAPPPGPREPAEVFLGHCKPAVQARS